MNSDTTATTPTTGWFKSSYSNPSQDCVEVCFDGGAVQIRDTKDHGAGPVITFTQGQWADVLAQVTGEGTAGGLAEPIVEEALGGGMILRDPATGAVLTYTPAETMAFVAGALVGEFDLPAAVPLV